MFFEYGDIISNFMSTTVNVCCFCIISMSYFLILKRLYNIKRTIIQEPGHGITAKTSNGQRSVGDENNLKPNTVKHNGGNKTARGVHIKAMKMFGTITLILVALLIIMTCVMANLIRNFHVVYMIYLNHNTNFLIYLYFDTDFRNDAFALITRIKMSKAVFCKFLSVEPCFT